MAVLVIPLVLASIPLAAWISSLLFCRFLVKRTNSAESLKYAAMPPGGFRAGAPAVLVQALAKLLTLRGR